MFAPAFNWCDGRCGRCPLAGTCTLRRKLLQREWVHAARKEDPNDPEVFLADMTADLDAAMRTIEEVAREEGIDLDAPAPPRVASLDAARLRRATLRIAVAHPSALLFSQKCARVAMQLAEPDAEAFAFDAAPNLLLLERLRAELGPALEDASAEVRDALALVDRILAPLFAAITAEPRSALDALVAKNEAPSPFCVVQGATSVA